MTANSKDKKLPTPQNTFANQSLDLRLAGVEGLPSPCAIKALQCQQCFSATTGRKRLFGEVSTPSPKVAIPRHGLSGTRSHLEIVNIPLPVLNRHVWRRVAKPVAPFRVVIQPTANVRKCIAHLE